MPRTVKNTFTATAGHVAIVVFIAGALCSAAVASDRWAVVIGIDKYQDLGELTTARNDAKAVAKVLYENAGFTKVLLLTDDAEEPQNRPTLATMRTRIENVAGLTEDGDTLVLFFSGHGLVIDRELALVPSDGNAKNAIPFDWVKEVLSKAQASDKIVILDACHAGASSKGVSGIAPSLLGESLGLTMLLSCSADQLSYPDTKGEESIFTKYLVEGLSGGADSDGDKSITTEEIYSFVRAQLKDWYITSGKLQTPEVFPETLPRTVLADISQPKAPAPPPVATVDEKVPAEQSEAAKEAAAEKAFAESLDRSTLEQRKTTLVAKYAEGEALYKNGDYTGALRTFQLVKRESIRVRIDLGYWKTRGVNSYIKKCEGK